MPKIYKCAKNCGSVKEIKERDNDGNIPLCCGVEMVEAGNDNEGESLGCFGCMGCYGGISDSEDDE